MSQETATSPVTTRSQWPFLAALAAALTLSLGPASVTYAVDFFVNGNIGTDLPFCGSQALPCAKIQFAIDKASPGDTIHVEDGPYFERLFIDKSLTIIGEPAGRLVDGAGGAGPVIEIGINATVTISGLIIQGGAAASAGGGILNFGTLTVTSCTIIHNNSNGDGGGIYNGGNLTLNNSKVIDNAANFGLGGGILNIDEAAILLHQSIVASNRASEDGGGIQNFGTVSGEDSTIEGNSAGGWGGNISNASSETATLTNVTISGGTAARGGGIDNTGTVNLNNVTITKNTATSGDGGGIFNDTGATVNVRNTILAGNTDTGGQAPDCAGTLTSQGHNLVGKNTGCTILAATGDLVGTGGSPIDPKLGPLGSNGGSTQTHALLAGGPAIDAGDPSPPGSGGTACEATDQRGVTRPQGPRCDIGAFEAPPPPAIPTLDGISQLALVLLLAGALGILTRYRARLRL